MGIENKYFDFISEGITNLITGLRCSLGNMRMSKCSMRLHMEWNIDGLLIILFFRISIGFFLCGKNENFYFDWSIKFVLFWRMFMVDCWIIVSCRDRREDIEFCLKWMFLFGVKDALKQKNYHPDLWNKIFYNFLGFEPSTLH